LTQFITPLEKFGSEKQEKKVNEKLSHRARAAFLDALRQLGIQPDTPKISLPNLPDQPHYVGIWLIKQYARSSKTGSQDFLPVMVYLNSQSSDIKVKANGFSDWLSYPQALLAIAQGKAEGFDKEGKALPFIEKHINEVARLGDTILFCHSQKLRNAWDWLQDTKINTELITFNNKENSIQSATEWPTLRVVRIRDEEETPEWYGQKDDDIGLPKGLFQISERVFGSSHGKSGKFQSSPRSSKIAAYTTAKEKSYDPEPEDFAWNPGLYELTVAYKQPDDEAWLWASVAHELRDMSLNYNEATAMPLPLHLANQIKEYTLPLDDFDED